MAIGIDQVIRRRAAKSDIANLVPASGEQRQTGNRDSGKFDKSRPVPGAAKPEYVLRGNASPRDFEIDPAGAEFGHIVDIHGNLVRRGKSPSVENRRGGRCNFHP